MTDATTSDDMLLAEIIEVAPQLGIAEAKLVPNGRVRLRFENGDILEPYVRRLHLIVSKSPTERSRLILWQNSLRNFFRTAVSYRKQSIDPRARDHVIPPKFA
jgi:hypothetical protein